MVRNPFRRSNKAGGPAPRRTSSTTKIAGIVGGLYLLGLIVIIGYAVSTNGRHFQYVGVGVLTAFAATVTGNLFGFLLGIPRAVSSGTVRQEVAPTPPATPTAPLETAVPGSNERSPNAQSDNIVGTTVSPRAARFAQSTNLAEISDWLTKLLLGAGLVSLTKLGKPLGALIHTIAAGLVTQTVTGPAVVMAGSIVITFLVLGFMVAYVVTTVWYSKLLEHVY